MINDVGGAIAEYSGGLVQIDLRSAGLRTAIVSICYTCAVLFPIELF